MKQTSKIKYSLKQYQKVVFVLVTLLQFTYSSAQLGDGGDGDPVNETDPEGTSSATFVINGDSESENEPILKLQGTNEDYNSSYLSYYNTNSTGDRNFGIRQGEGNTTPDALNFARGNVGVGIQPKYKFHVGDLRNNELRYSTFPNTFMVFNQKLEFINWEGGMILQNTGFNTDVSGTETGSSLYLNRDASEGASIYLGRSGNDIVVNTDGRLSVRDRMWIGSANVGNLWLNPGNIPISYSIFGNRDFFDNNPVPPGATGVNYSAITQNSLGTTNLFSFNSDIKFNIEGVHKMSVGSNGLSFPEQIGNGVSFTDDEQYKIHMGEGLEYKYGPVDNLAIKTNIGLIDNTSNGLVWGVKDQIPIAALSNTGAMQLKESLSVGGNPVVSGNPVVLTVDGRMYISDDDTDKRQGFSIPLIQQIAGTNEEYNNYLLWVEEGIASTHFSISEVEDWPDYVFKTDYKLPTLFEIERAINEKGHLPTLPPASTIEASGFSATDMTKRIVKTIEEMTLHSIEQYKQTESQDALLNNIAIRLEKLETIASKN